MRNVLTVSSFCLCLTSAQLISALPASALDPSKLSIYQPLTVQDAYPTTMGTVQVQGSARYDETSTGRDLIDLRPVVKWGAFEHFQLSFAAPFRLGDASSSRSGDSLVAAFYQFAEDRNGFPAMALSQSVHEYYGDLHGTETVTNLLATKSLSGDLSATEIHLNLSYRRLYDGASDEKETAIASLWASVARSGETLPFSRTSFARMIGVSARRRISSRSAHDGKPVSTASSLWVSAQVLAINLLERAFLPGFSTRSMSGSKPITIE